MFPAFQIHWRDVWLNDFYFRYYNLNAINCGSSILTFTCINVFKYCGWHIFFVLVSDRKQMLVYRKQGFNLAH